LSYSTHNTYNMHNIHMHKIKIMFFMQTVPFLLEFAITDIWKLGNIYLD